MNPLDWSLLAGPLPVILLAGTLLALAWLAAGRNAPGRGWLRRGARGGTAGGAVSVRWLAIWVPLIVVAAGGVIALLTWLINNVWRPFPDLLPFTVVFWSWVALAGLVLAFARLPLLRTWPRRAAAIAAGVLVLAAAANQVNGYFQAYPTLRVALAPWLDPKPVLTKTGTVKQAAAKPGQRQHQAGQGHPRPQHDSGRQHVGKRPPDIVDQPRQQGDDPAGRHHDQRHADREPAHRGRPVGTSPAYTAPQAAPRRVAAGR